MLACLLFIFFFIFCLQFWRLINLSALWLDLTMILIAVSVATAAAAAAPVAVVVFVDDTFLSLCVYFSCWNFHLDLFSMCNMSMILAAFFIFIFIVLIVALAVQPSRCLPLHKRGLRARICAIYFMLRCECAVCFYN